jgi:ribosomal protein S18 acetylase RimI-like enzyme
MNITIARVTENDFNLCRALRLRALSDSPEAFGGTLKNALERSLDEYKEDAIRWATSEKSTLFLGTFETVPIGMIGAYIEENEKRSYLCGLWVEPEYRNKGVASRLCSQAISWLVKRSSNFIYLWVANQNQVAVSLYKKLGFKATNETQRLPSNENIIETLYVYNHG